MAGLHISSHWDTIGFDWPNRTASFFHTAAGLNWHVQQMGNSASSKIVLLHGTGAATHSFRELMPLLARDLHVTTFDLPGHGFTSSNSPLDLSLPGITQSVALLLNTLNIKPDLMLGHSAGAAIAMRYALEHPDGIRHLFAINAALAPIKGNALLSPMAKLLFANPFSSKLFSLTATQSSLGDRLLQSAGPRLDKAGRNAYTSLMGNASHVRGALGMMASWDLEPLARQLPKLKIPCTLIVAKDDRLVPPSDSRKAALKIPNAEVIEIETGGHLLHEIKSTEIAETVLQRLEKPPKSVKRSSNKRASA